MRSITLETSDEKTTQHKSTSMYEVRENRHCGLVIDMTEEPPVVSDTVRLTPCNMYSIENCKQAIANLFKKKST